MIGKLTIGVKWSPKTGAVNVPIHRPSPLGNPFAITPQRNREEACELYENWLMDQMNRGEHKILKELNHIGKSLAQGKDVHLLCFCKGKGHVKRKCHGDFIKEVIDERLLEYLAERST